MKYRVEDNKNINDLKSKQPAYMQLYLQLRKDIVSGAYNYGAKLPSKRILAEESGVSVITVEHTYAILCDEGYIEARQRSGYFVIYKEKDFISVAENEYTKKYNDYDIKRSESHATKSMIPYSVLAKTMRKVMLDYGESILVKSPNPGCPELRNAISHYLARSNGIVAKPEQIIIGSGAEYLYSLVVQLLGSDRLYAIENPSYEKIRQVYTACGVKYEMLKMGNDGIKSGELERSEATVLHVTPFNSYPSNITASVSKRNEYIKWAQCRNGYIIEDNYGSELTLSTKVADTVFSMTDTENVIYINTFSKTIAPSMRVGYMVLPEKLLEIFQKNLGFYSCTVPVFEQYVIASLINSGDFERHINRARREGRKQSGHI